MQIKAQFCKFTCQNHLEKGGRSSQEKLAEAISDAERFIETRTDAPQEYRDKLKKFLTRYKNNNPVN